MSNNKLAAVLLLAFMCATVVHANIELPSDWVAPDYGVCTLPVVDPVEPGPNYTGDNRNPLIAEGVGYGSVGRTCSFNSGGKNNYDGIDELWRDDYLLAASQSLYNGKKMPLNWNSESPICDTSLVSREEALEPDGMCGAMCGVCVLVSGTEGAAIFMINEIADIGAVNETGRGLSLHIDQHHDSSIRVDGGTRKDITYKFVSCPTDRPIRVRTRGWWGTTGVYFVMLNPRNRLVSVELRGRGTGADTEWVPLVRSWANQWKWESAISWQAGTYGSIFRGSEEERFDLRLSDIAGNQVLCTDMGETSTGDIVTCRNDGVDQQFPNIPVSVDVACDGKSTSNLQYYKGDLPTGSGPQPQFFS